MCQQAARITDPCIHGGMVAMGSDNVVIGALPAARKGDAHVCPIHPPGKIVSASTTVMINGVGAARRLDTIQCATPPSPAGGAGVVYDVTDGNANKLLYYDSKTTKDPNGKVTAWEGGAGLGQVQRSGQTADGTVGGSFKLSSLSAQAKVSGDYGGRTLDASAAGAQVEGTAYVAPKGDKYNPYQSVTVTGKAFSAMAKGDVLAGYDGNRVGLVASGGASAGLLGGSVQGRQGIPIPFTNWTIDTKATVGAGLGGAGIGAGAGAYWDKGEGRFHLLGYAMGQFVAGLGLNLDISIGKKFEAPPPPPAPAPDGIRMGLETVFIGG